MTNAITTIVNPVENAVKVDGENGKILYFIAVPGLEGEVEKVVLAIYQDMGENESPKKLADIELPPDIALQAHKKMEHSFWETVGVDLPED